MASVNSRFNSFLESPGLELKQFYRKTSENIFPEADYIPDVLKHSMAKGDRFIKQFLNNPHNNLRIFYFQLFRLCYMPNLVHTLPFINRLKKVVLSNNFKILFSFDTEEYSNLFNNLQFKRLFVQFIDYLDYQEQPCIQIAINDYPIMDIVLIHIMRSLLATKNINPDFNQKIETKIVFKQLAGIFKHKLSLFDDYWVFEDSDFIVYAENQWELYISYQEKRQIQQKIKSIKNKLPNQPAQQKSIQTVPTSSSIQQKPQIKHERNRFLSPVQTSSSNFLSPKIRTFSKMFLPSLNFTSGNALYQKLSPKQLIKPCINQDNNSKIQETNSRKLNPECNKCQNYPIKNQRGVRKQQNKQTVQLFKRVNKQNYNDSTTRNVRNMRNLSFQKKNQNRSRSFLKIGDAMKVMTFKAQCDKVNV